MQASACIIKNRRSMVPTPWMQNILKRIILQTSSAPKVSTWMHISRTRMYILLEKSWPLVQCSVSVIISSILTTWLYLVGTTEGNQQLGVGLRGEVNLVTLGILQIIKPRNINIKKLCYYNMTGIYPVSNLFIKNPMLINITILCSPYFQ